MLFIEYNERVKGKAVFITTFVERGEIVHTLSGRVSSIRTKYTIEIGENQHILDDFGQYINHSSTDPTVYIDGHSVVALRDIMPGEEICFDYNHSETEMAAPFIDRETGESVCGKNRVKR